MDIFVLIAIGAFAGALAGFFGIGGGIVIVPLLMLLLNYAPQRATGTSLAVLLPPIGIFAVMQYYRAGHIDLKAAGLIASGFIVGSILTATYVNAVPAPWLKRGFAMLLMFAAGQILFSTFDKAKPVAVAGAVGGGVAALALGAVVRKRPGAAPKAAPSGVGRPPGPAA